jgi:glycosyltransferase involved in cell wall biosynthesis
VVHQFAGGCEPDGRPRLLTAHGALHLARPEDFSIEERQAREEVLRSSVDAAAVVVTPSEWGRFQFLKCFPEVGPDRVRAIRWGPPTEFAPALPGEVRPTAACLYPAATWPHKNHLRLLAALARLRDEGVALPAVCAGEWYGSGAPAIQRYIKEKNLSGLVSFPGAVPPPVLRMLYRSCRFVVYPSLHEWGGLPVLEAWLDGAAVACSSSGALPEYAGEAALLFDADSVESMAAALLRLHEDRPLRQDLARRGARRLSEFRWEAAAAAYREAYRRLA